MQAQVQCGNQPQDVPPDVQQRIQGDVEGKAQLFTKLLGDVNLKGKVDSSKNEVYQKYIDLDKAQIDHYMIWVACQNIMLDRQLTSPEKLKLWIEIYRELTAKPSGKGSEILSNDHGQIERFELDGGQTILLTLDRLTFTAIGTPFAANGNLIGVSVEGKVQPLSVGSNLTFPFSGGFCKVTLLSLIKERHGGDFLLKCDQSKA
ncbi:MAG TPA: hypothetical protein VKI44_13795 [Acetobacteraceae bacterium]|nr:hypothetical protein [Acetobacteraceae bacterium]